MKLLPVGRKQMRYLLSLLIIFVVLDGIITQYLINGGMARESNPFLQPLVGDVGFIILKVVGALLCAFILWDVYKHFRTAAVIVTWIAVVGYGLIVAWNSSLALLA